MEEADTPSLVDLLRRTAAESNLPAPDLSVPAAQDYLDTLQSLPLKALLAEAGAISADAGGVEGELTNLCYREYPTFISVHKCSAAVTSAFDDFSSSLGRLLDAVPALEDECRTFVRSTAGVQDARAKAALVQEHQDKLFDLLEIPQLMETCVRNGYYQEALELSAHTDSLVERYPGVELVQDVAKEVDGVLQLMLAQLLALLREPIKLPALVKTVGYLRRLSIIGEEELGLAFLVSRLSNFRTQLGALERDRHDPVRYVRKYVDLFREHVFDIISQFSAIFDGAAGAAQLASFVGQCVDELIAVVASNVPKMNDAASLSSILVQLGYCALAFARVGLDFSSLVTDPFADAVSSAFGGAVADATKSLTLTLAQAEKSPGSPAHALMAPEAIPALLSADSPLSFVSWSGSLDTLPDLAKFPALAILTNAHLTALNALRLLAPLHLHPALAATQCAALTQCTHAVAQYVRQAAALSDPLHSPTAPRHGHKRSNSGRAHLIRQNSETQLTPEVRAARRREAQRTCVAFADAWARAVVPLLRGALDTGVFEEALDDALELHETLETLQAWIRDQDEGDDSKEAKEVSRTPNGSGAATPLAVHDEAGEAREIVDEPGEMAARGASPVKRASSPLKAASPALPSPVKAASPAPPSPVKAASPAPPSPVKAASPAPRSPVKAPSPAPASPVKAPSLPASPVKAASPARSPSPTKVSSPAPSVPASPSKPSSPLPTLLEPSSASKSYFAIETPSASALATPAAFATPAAVTPSIETPPAVAPEPAPAAGPATPAKLAEPAEPAEPEPVPEPQPEAGPPPAADADTPGAEVNAEDKADELRQLQAEAGDGATPAKSSGVDVVMPVEIAETAEAEVEAAEPTASKTETATAEPEAALAEPAAEAAEATEATEAGPTPPAESPAPVNGSAAHAASTAEKTGTEAESAGADASSAPGASAVPEAASAEGGKPAPDAAAETPATATLAPPETPGEDDDPAESTEPSRPPSPSPSAGTPAPTGGGKKKKKKNKKKK